jgi:hypothetical protein
MQKTLFPTLFFQQNNLSSRELFYPQPTLLPYYILVIYRYLLLKLTTLGNALWMIAIVDHQALKGRNQP